VIDDGRVLLTLVGLLVGAGLGAWLTYRQCKRHFDARLRESSVAIELQYSGLVDKFRAAHAKQHAEIEQQRSSTARQVAAAVAEPRAAVGRLEQRLQAAYAELDRLRDASGVTPARPVLEDGHGFAATQPMHAGM
jgi:multidrug resistance efflux pump